MFGRLFSPFDFDTMIMGPAEEREKEEEATPDERRTNGHSGWLSIAMPPVAITLRNGLQSARGR